MTEDGSFYYHEVTFFSIQYKVGFVAPFQHLLQVFEAVVKRTSKYGEVVHEYFHVILDKLMEYCCHARRAFVCMRMSRKGSQSFEHLIDERKWKVIFSGRIIQLTVVDTYAPSSNGPLWDELILLILYYGHPSLLWDNLDKAYLWTVGDGID
ncbi:hypothetical protein Tco_0895729 [Tanacetum coccineum]|uniref:Uncharacterized protein n=1 Tax=Tanacetum coccineum TaxID=301880 RepID=A0ABQ5CGW3_9ASTR